MNWPYNSRALRSIVVLVLLAASSANALSGYGASCASNDDCLGDYFCESSLNCACDPSLYDGTAKDCGDGICVATSSTCPSPATEVPTTSEVSDDSDGCFPGWKAAVGTMYDSWPKPGTKECINYSGCKWAGQFKDIDSGPCSKGSCKPGAQWLSGGLSPPNMCCRWPEGKIAKWSMAATYAKYPELLNRKLNITIINQKKRRFTTVNVKDVCKDSDCDNCCKRNTGNGKYPLIDIEKWPASRALGFKFDSPTFDINDVNQPAHNGKRPGAPSGLMGICYKDVGPADKIP